MARVCALVVLASLILSPAVCRADPALAGRQPEPPPPPSASMWQRSWPNFSWLEGAATVSAGIGTLVLALNEPPRDPRWQGGILFDDAVRSGLRLESQSGRQKARSIGDLPYYAAGLIPLVVDPVLVAWLGHGDPKAALNLGLVALESFSYVGFLSFVSTRISVRERPDSAECRRLHPDGSGCEEVDTEAFWSGHTSIVAVSAGVVCANHRYLPLWKYKALDLAACVFSTAGALGTGVSRLLSDRHYATDVIAGSIVGFGIGYAVPVLLHYSRRQSSLTVSVQTDARCPSGCVSVGGSF